jgi:hypothetical protein
VPCKALPPGATVMRVVCLSPASNIIVRAVHTSCYQQNFLLVEHYPEILDSDIRQRCSGLALL